MLLAEGNEREDGDEEDEVGRYPARGFITHQIIPPIMFKTSSLFLGLLTCSTFSKADNGRTI